MDQKTLEALHGSIAKWQAIVDGTGKNQGPSNCPLCRLFLYQDGIRFNDCCRGCPVADRTGKSFCASTPYERYEAHEKDPDTPANRAFLEAAAIDELAFLQSLLPGVTNGK